jgi:hypothetical protein
VNGVLVQTAIDLVLIFGITAAAVAGLTEGISRFIGLRQEYLLRGVRQMVDGKSDFGLWRRKPDGWPVPDKTEPARVAMIMSHPLVASSATQATPPAQAGNAYLTNRQRRALPSYISGQTFANALIDILLPGHFRSAGASAAASSAGRAAGSERRSDEAAVAAAEAAGVEAAEAADAAAGGADAMAALSRWAEAGVASAYPDPLAEALRPMLVGAQGKKRSFKVFRNSVAGWYDNQMISVSRAYKRHVGRIALGVSVILVIALNLNAIKIVDSVYSFQTASASCETQKSAACPAPNGLLRTFIWSDTPACAHRSCSWMDRQRFTSIGGNWISDVGAFLLVLVGWALMVVALIPGARFWFDQLTRLGVIKLPDSKPSS